MAGGERTDLHYLMAFFHPVMGGVETRVREFGLRMAARGHSVTVHTMASTLAGERLPAEDALGPIRIVRTKPWFVRGAYKHLFFPKLPRGALVDVHGYPFLEGDWARMTRGRDLVRVHTPEGAPFLPGTPGARAMLRGYDALLGLPTLRSARQVVVSSANESQWMTARGVPAANITRIPHGVTEEAFGQYAPDAVRERWGLKRYVLFLGRLYFEKGPLDLVRAMALLPPHLSDVAAVLAGPDQGEGPRALALAREMGLGHRIVVPGPVKEQEKWALLAGAEMLVLPSAWEAQGIVVQEAWAQGKPVVVSDRGGLPFIVEHGKTGLVVPFGDTAKLAQAIAALLYDSARAAAMGARARELAQREYRWDALAPRTEAMYEQVLGR